MTILVVGTRVATEATFTALSRAGTDVEYANTPEAAVARIAAAPGRFALVLSEAQGGQCAEHRFAECVEEMGSHAMVLFMREPRQAPELGGNPPICAIEQTPDGPRLLRCALARARAQPDRQPELADALGDQPTVFAYSAPAKRQDR